MTIGRMQMNKQLYGIGSKSLSENGRDRFGLGSFIRKIIPNEISKIAVKAAPFVAPFNPALAAGMAGIGGYDQTGKFGSSLRNAALVYGGGQAARYLGGAGFQDTPFSGNALQNFTSLTNPMSGSSIFEGFGAPGTPVQNLKDVNPVSPTGSKALAERASQIGQDAAKTFSERTAEMSLDSAVGSGGIEDYLAQTAKNATSSTPYADAANKILSGNPSTMWEGTKSLGKEALNDVFYKTVDGERVLDKPVAFAALSGAYSYYDALQQAKKLGLDENSYTKEMYEADVASNKFKYQANLPYESFGIQTAANGGRIGYAEGSREGVVSLTDQNSGVVYRDPKTGEPLTIDEFLRRAAEDEAEIQLLKEGEEPGSKFISRPDDAPSIRLPEKGIRSLDTGDFENETKNISNSKKLKSKYESDPYVTQLLKRIGTEAFFGGEPNPTSKYREFDKMSPEYQDRVETRREKDRRFFQQPGYGVHTTREIPRYDDYGMEMKAGGGRMGYMMGTEVPMRQNQGGISELDYRKTGGFVPVGVKEKADDVPAMLSKNEFVFTADAVKAAGGGSVSKGAQKMYKLMKSLEGKFKGKKIRA
jgi:hypothetical protein